MDGEEWGCRRRHRPRLFRRRRDGICPLLSDRDLRANALAFLAQHLIVLLDPADIVVNLHDAYQRPEFGERHYAFFPTGQQIPIHRGPVRPLDYPEADSQAAERPEYRLSEGCLPPA
jgi:hypothetical protein